MNSSKNCYKTDNLLICTKCRITLYCSEKCQREDWFEHQQTCSSCLIKDESKCNNALCSKKENLKLCAKCKITQYCCQKCQMDDWQNHKSSCIQLKKELHTTNEVLKKFNFKDSDTIDLINSVPKDVIKLLNDIPEKESLTTAYVYFKDNDGKEYCDHKDVFPYKLTNNGCYITTKNKEWNKFIKKTPMVLMERAPDCRRILVMCTNIIVVIPICCCEDGICKNIILT